MSFKEFNKNTGVYIIRCLHSGKEYCGYSINIPERIYHHKQKLRIGKHPNNHLQSSYNIDPDRFEYIILIDNITMEEAMNIELDYIKDNDLVKLGYNQTYQTTKYCGDKIRKSLKGRKLSKTHKENLKGPRLNCRGSNNRHAKIIIQMDLDGNIIKEHFTTISQLSRELGLSRNSIANVINGWSNSGGGYKWAIKEKKINYGWN